MRARRRSATNRPWLQMSRLPYRAEGVRAHSTGIRGQPIDLSRPGARLTANRWHPPDSVAQQRSREYCSLSTGALNRVLAPAWRSPHRRYNPRSRSAPRSAAFSTDQVALTRRCRVQLGNTILPTDIVDWTDEELVLVYRSSSHASGLQADRMDLRFLRSEPQPSTNGSEDPRPCLLVRHPAESGCTANVWQELCLIEWFSCILASDLAARSVPCISATGRSTQSN